MNIFFEQIPQELKELPNWVCWALETRGGKTTKILTRRKRGKRPGKQSEDLDRLQGSGRMPRIL